MWAPQPWIDEVRKHPGWKMFNRECGKLNFYIDNIEKQGKGFRAGGFKLRDRNAPPYDIYPMEAGTGRTVIEACVDAYRKAIQIGHMPDTHLERLFSDDEDLIGFVATNSVDKSEQMRNIALVDDEDLIG